MSIASIISWIVFGLIAGAVAKLLMPGDDPGGWLITILIGIVGAFLGGWLGQTLIGAGATETWTWTGFITAVIGAIILLFLYRLVAGRRSSSTTTRRT